MTASIAPSAALSATVEVITPRKAQEWLGANVHNRSLRNQTVVAKYANDMNKGAWRFTGEAIKFSTSGALLDGQHRLHALIRANVTLPMLVIRNLEDDSQEVMDSGAKRSPADALGLRGEKSTALLASAASAIISGCSATRKNVSTSDILDVIDADESIRWIVSEVLPTLKLSMISGTVSFYAYWRLNQIDPNRTALFFSALASLANLPSGSPILALHKKLSSIGAERSGKASSAYRQEAIAAIFSAWNAWQRNESRTIIKTMRNALGKVSVPEPILTPRAAAA